MKERLKEEIKYYTELVKFILWVALADVTGVIALLRVSKPTLTEYMLLFLGNFTTFILVIIGVRLHYHIKIKFKNLESCTQ